LNRPLPDFAQRMLAQLDGQTRVSALLATGPSRRAYMAQLLFALECVGAVAFRDTPQTVDEASGMGPSAGAVAGAAEGLAELDRLAALLDAERWAEALGVMEDDDARTIEEAAENLDAPLVSLVTQEPIIIRPSMSLREAADLMAHLNVGRLPVLEDAKLVGIITRSDLVGAHRSRLRANRHRSRVRNWKTKVPAS